MFQSTSVPGAVIHDLAVLIHDEKPGDASDLIELCHTPVCVEKNGSRKPPLDPGTDPLGWFSLVDQENRDPSITIPTVDSLKRRRGISARRTPGGPELHDDHASPIVSKTHRAAIQLLQSKILSRDARLQA